MHKIIFSRKAKNDLIEIFNYIWKDNEFYAIKALKSIKSTINILKDFPRIWKIIDNEERYIVEKNYKYKIVYENYQDNILILAIYKYKNTWQ